MTKYLLVAFLFFSTCFSIQAQENTLNNQFNTITEKSNNYKDYKVVKKNKLNFLQRNVLDSVALLQQKIKTSSSEVIQQKSEITTLQQDLEATKNELIISKDKEDGIPFFGTMTKKTTYNTVALSIIGVLLLIIIILFFKYKSSFGIIKTTKTKLEETEEEYESFRQRTLEKEQQLRRKLQDEINKNKVSK